MSRPARTALFAVAAVVIGGGLVWAFAGLPRAGDYHGVDGLTIGTSGSPSAMRPTWSPR